MQILLASAKIMNNKVNVLPDLTLSTSIFSKEAESFARDMAQYSTETIMDGILPYRMEGHVELPHGENHNMFQSVIPSIYPDHQGMNIKTKTDK